MPLDIIDAADAFCAQTGAAVLATVIETWGSAPVPVGGQMAIAADGRFAGSVSGGCIEGDVIAAAAKVLATQTPRVLAFGVATEDALRAGLPCGGTVRIHLDPLTGSDGRAFLHAVKTAALRRDPLYAIYDLGTGKRALLAPGTRPMTADGSALAEDLVDQLARGVSALDKRPGGETFYKSFAPPARIVIVGATHIAQVLTELARLTGYATIVVDPRDGYGTAERFAASPVITDWPQSALETVRLDRFTAVVALAHVAHLDDETLGVALRSDCGYIGALGSRKNHAARCARLRDQGFSEADIARIRAPVGLDIGALTPPEIALSILAEIVETVRGKRRN
jgi:xanthine dehydrogenase accessory factor